MSLMVSHRHVRKLAMLSLSVVFSFLSQAMVHASEMEDLEVYFDGSMQGNADEAAVTRNSGPAYYHFTLDGLSAFTALQHMRVAVIPHESHATRRLDMRVWTSLPGPIDEETVGYDFSLRDETALAYDYYNADGELIPVTEDEDEFTRDIKTEGWIEVPLDHLSMDTKRTMRMTFVPYFRGAANLPYVEVTGILEDGSEATTIVRYDFNTQGERATANQVHPAISASLMWPQGFPRPRPIVSVERPQGAYSAVQLQIAVPDGPESYQDLKIFGGMRGNQMAVDQWTRITEPGGYLTRDGAQFSGSFERQHRGGNPIPSASRPPLMIVEPFPAP